MSQKIEPALTPEEWAAMEAHGVYLADGLVFVGPPSDDSADRQIVERPHPAAALCLYNQPFGFTHEDVDMLIGLASGWDRENPERLASLADRIEALLPPREP